MFNTIHPNRWLFWLVALSSIIILIVWWQSKLFFIEEERVIDTQINNTVFPEPLLGGDRDEHGCIPSAGYSWCEEKQKCLRMWEEECVVTSKITYTNEENGFELTFPASYKGYLAQTVILFDGGEVIEFSKDGSALFFIKAYRNDWWGDKVLVDQNGMAFIKEFYPDEPTLGKKIAENDRFTFVWSEAQECINDKLCDLMSDLPTILQTFKLIEALNIGTTETSLGLPKCFESQKYLIIEKQYTDQVGSSFLIKYKEFPQQQFTCAYDIGPGDFEINNREAEYFFALKNDFLILDVGTGPQPRRLVIYDLIKRARVFSDTYSRPIAVDEYTVEYWTETSEPATSSNCTELSEYKLMGLGSAIDEHVILDLNTLSKTFVGEKRCAPRQ